VETQRTRSSGIPVTAQTQPRMLPQYDCNSRVVSPRQWRDKSFRISRPRRFFKDHFTIDCPPDAVFDMFGDVARVAACLPGASLTGVPTRERAEGFDPRKTRPGFGEFPMGPRISSATPKICRAGSLAQAAISAAGLPRRARSSTNSYRSSKALRRVSNFRSAII